MNRRELAFCAAYAKTRSPTKAAEMAGYSQPRHNGPRLLNRPHIQEYLNRLGEKVQDHIALDAAEVVNQIGAVAMTNATEFWKQAEDGLWVGLSPSELNDRQRVAVKKVHVRTTKQKYVDDDGEVRERMVQEFKYDLYDKSDALVQLGKHFEIFGSDGEESSKGNRFRNLPAGQLERLGALLEQGLNGETVDGAVLSDDRGH